MQCGQNVQLLNVKMLLHHVTSRLEKVKTVKTITFDYYAFVSYRENTNCKEYQIYLFDT